LLKDKKNSKVFHYKHTLAQIENDRHTDKILHLSIPVRRRIRTN